MKRRKVPPKGFRRDAADGKKMPGTGICRHKKCWVPNKKAFCALCEKGYTGPIFFVIIPYAGMTPERRAAAGAAFAPHTKPN